ncbi:YeeE/YedE family protein [Undibacterium jejuense]|uniref:YeeE/YedE family protein n=1 Tax=Undibacterium jejuense TaxID=1344949 RepID=A0A923KNG7_9BURK|nr:DUF6691 family protein [Undibacterium jejuense]MBC3860546.1 YeeE/YedE family protein [Undibacterium jejuense]
MTYFTSLFAGLLFGLGLIVSGMVNPGKVLGFLDLAGAWDPSLMLVMLGAIAVGLFAFVIAKKRVVSFFGEKIDLPTNTAIDLRLVGGSALFGIGWGLAGFCPGPALVGLSMGLPSALIFVAAMIAGMLLFEFIEKIRAPQ